MQGTPSGSEGVETSDAAERGTTHCASGSVTPEGGRQLRFGEGPDAHLITLGNVVAIDIETTGMHPQAHAIRLIALADGTNTLTLEDCAPLGSLLADPSITKVFHNAAFEISFFEAQGLSVVNYEDTMLLAQVLSNNEGAHDLASVAATYLGETVDKTLQHPRHWQGDLTSRHHAYNLRDAILSRRLFDVLRQEVHVRGLEAVYERERAILPAVIKVRRDGIALDAAAWKVDLAEHVQGRDDLADRIKASLCAPPDLNLNSPKHQLLPLLRQRGIPLRDTKESTLAKYAAQYPVLQDIIEYRKLNKLVTSYEKTYLSKVCPDGRIHASFRAIGTETGRMSCSAPNVQQVHSVLRPYFRAAPGYTYVIADYSQAQLRIIAEVSGDPSMMHAYRNGEDLHVNTAKALLHKEEVTAEDRQLAKGVNFGLAFGLSAVGLQRDLKKKYGIDISGSRAVQIRNRFFRTYKGVAAWQDRQIRAGTITSLGGRVWESLPKPYTRRGASTARAKDWTTRLNYPIQAVEAEGLKEALRLLIPELTAHPEWRLVNIVHDSIMLEVPTADADAALQVLRDCMAKGMERFVASVPVEVDVTTSDRWSK